MFFLLSDEITTGFFPIGLRWKTCYHLGLCIGFHQYPNVTGLTFLFVVSLSTNAIVTRFYLIGVWCKTYYHIDLSIGISYSINIDLHQYPNVSGLKFLFVFSSFSTDAITTRFYPIGIWFKTYYHLDLNIGLHQYPNGTGLKFLFVFSSFSTDAIVTRFLNCLNGPRLNC